MKPAPFDYVAARSVEEAVGFLAEAGEGAKLLAGGQSLVPLLALRLARPELVVDINGVEGLDALEVEGRRLRVGALVRHRAVERDPRVASAFPFVSMAVSRIGHVAIRNRGTVGGSLAHADPAAEWPALLLALDGEVEVASPRGRRVVASSELFDSYLTTSLAPDEMICEVRGALPEGRVATSFLELARREGDFALVGVAVVVAADQGAIRECRIALSGVGSTAVRAREAEAVLQGSSAGPKDVETAAAAVAEEIDPPGDIHGSSAYRRKVAAVLCRRALLAATAQLDGR